MPKASFRLIWFGDACCFCESFSSFISDKSILFLIVLSKPHPVKLFRLISAYFGRELQDLWPTDRIISGASFYCSHLFEKEDFLMTQTIQPSTCRGFSGTTLKCIACITMLIDHIGASCLEVGILRPMLDAGTLSSDTLASHPLYLLDCILRFTGRLAFPIFCFLLVEGFVHTHDVKRYFLRLLLFGLLSEVPFDLAFFRLPVDPSQQNVYWTLALGVLAMTGLQRFETADNAVTWKGLLCAGGCVLLAFLAHTDYNGIGVIIICALYLTRADRKRQCLVGALLFAYELTAPLAFVLIWFYNGQRGQCSKTMQKCFYWFYPAHIALLAVITNLLL